MNVEELSRPALMGERVIAEYTEQQIPARKGNPLIEALPDIYEPIEVGRMLYRCPDYDDLQKDWGTMTRIHCVQGLDDFLVPLQFNIDIENRISLILRHGYESRNPLNPLYTRQFTVGFKAVLEEGIKNGKNAAGVRSSASGFGLCGISGSGKSAAVETGLLLYPQVVLHTKYHNNPFILKQLVWLKVECPAHASANQV